MKQARHTLCLLLGSNIEPEKNLPLSIHLLGTQLTLLQTSSVWESEAIGSGGPNFLNAAVLAMTTLDASAVKEEVIRPLEARLGRVRTHDKNFPRTMDIDIILFENDVLDPSLWHHAHRAVPVSDIFPDYRSESGASLKDVALYLASLDPVWIRPDVSMYPFSTVFKEEVMVHIKQAYEDPDAADGARYLVDRLWPRGMNKERLAIEGWLKNLAPSEDLRRWFGHEPEKWEEFQRRYTAELDGAPDAWQPLLEASRKGPVTLLYASHDHEHNNAVVLKEYIERRLSDP